MASKQPRKPRNLFTLALIVKNKGGVMGDRCTRRKRSRGDSRRVALREASE